jgi:hypothetical protein
MAETFLDRIPTLTDAELREYLDGHMKYKREAIEAAAAELRRRGLEVPEGLLESIRAGVRQRDTAPAGPLKPGLFRDAQGPRLDRIRAVTAGIVTAGILLALVLYRAAQNAAPAPFDLEPTDSKAYLRQVEMMGGKANVLASSMRLWFTGLWQGTHLAFTVFWISVLLAAGFWVFTTRKS